MKKSIIFIYGAASYTAFLAGFLYSIGFIGGFGVPKSLDSPPSERWQAAVATDVALLMLFALQHSIMARPWFKRFLTRFIPASSERSTYVLASSLALALLFWTWEPVGGVVWNLDAAIGRSLLYAGFAFGWAVVLITTFVINHFDLFGLRQVWLQLRGLPHTPVPFVAPLLYRMVRHPLYVGWLFAFWSTPTMTISHLFFAVATTAYILIAIRFEEADLIREHPQYADYRKSVPMLVPRIPLPVETPAATAPQAKTATY